MDLCPFCGDQIEDEDFATLGQKGCDGIVRANLERGVHIEVVPGQKVHISCRRNHLDLKRTCTKRRRPPDVSTEEPRPRSMRSHEPNFNMKEECFYCSNPDTFEVKWGKGHKLIPCRELESYDRIQAYCLSRNDDWADCVSKRISTVIDSPADAVYHTICATNFRTGKCLPQCSLPESNLSILKRKAGRRKNYTQYEAFVNVMSNFIENQDDRGQATINDMIKEMSWYLESSLAKPYCFTDMKGKIKDYLGDQCVIRELDGRPNTVTLIDSAAKILHDFHVATKNGESDSESEKLRVLTTACRLIENDIRSIQQSRDIYPDMNNLDIEELLKYLPESLRYFIRKLTQKTTSPLKIASLGHALVQVARPRSVMMPLQLGLAVQLHTHFGSRFLIDSLTHHGFCLSYSEVQMFERNAAVSCGTDISDLDIPGHSVNYSADNVDSESISLNGRGQFHGMGIIASVTPGVRRRLVIPRIKITNDDIRRVGAKDISICPKLKDVVRSVIYRELPAITFEDPTDHLETLWKGSKKAGWSGMMQMVTKGTYPGKLSIIFLPMIDLNASDPNCIYTMLCFVSDHARRYNVAPVITVDQPIWWKAKNIIEYVQSGARSTRSIQTLH